MDIASQFILTGVNYRNTVLQYDIDDKGENMLASKVTGKFQTTIPAEIRKNLGIKQGDLVAFEVEDGKVVLRRVSPVDIEYVRSLAGTLSEWGSQNDDTAYRDL